MPDLTRWRHHNSISLTVPGEIDDNEEFIPSSLNVGPEAYPGDGQTIAYTGTAGTSAAVDAILVDVVVTSAAFVAIGSAPTATTSDYFCMANTTYRFPLTPGNKVSAIQDSTGGNLHVHPVG